MQGVEVEPNNPHVFWSAAEDGTVRQYDTRLPSNSQKAWESSNCLLSVKAVGPASANRSIELKGISLNKVALCCHAHPLLLALPSEVGSIRRVASWSIRNISPNSH